MPIDLLVNHNRKQTHLCGSAVVQLDSSFLCLLSLSLHAANIWDTEVARGGTLDLFPAFKLPPTDGEENLHQSEYGNCSKAAEAVRQVGKRVALKINKSRESIVLLDKMAQDA